MEFVDDTPAPGTIPDLYPSQPPINLLAPALLTPANFFAFEGIDGAGKSTLIRQIVAACAQQDLRTRVLKLGRSDVTAHALERAKWINANPMTFSLLNWVTLYEQATQARHDFARGDVKVLVDRYIPTLKVRGLLEGLPTAFMTPLEAGLPRPAVLFFIDCDPDLCCERILSGHRQITYFEAGSRIVDREGDPMIERDPSARRSSPERVAGLRAHLHRMRAALKRMIIDMPNVVVIDNSGAPHEALGRILARLGLVNN
jgi:thymidylate kinase